MGSPLLLLLLGGVAALKETSLIHRHIEKEDNSSGDEELALKIDHYNRSNSTESGVAALKGTPHDKETPLIRRPTGPEVDPDDVEGAAKPWIIEKGDNSSWDEELVWKIDHHNRTNSTDSPVFEFEYLLWGSKVDEFSLTGDNCEERLVSPHGGSEVHRMVKCVLYAGDTWSLTSSLVLDSPDHIIFKGHFGVDGLAPLRRKPVTEDPNLQELEGFVEAELGQNNLTKHFIPAWQKAVSAVGKFASMFDGEPKNVTENFETVKGIVDDFLQAERAVETAMDPMMKKMEEAVYTAAGIGAGVLAAEVVLKNNISTTIPFETSCDVCDPSCKLTHFKEEDVKGGHLGFLPPDLVPEDLAFPLPTAHICRNPSGTNMTIAVEDMKLGTIVPALDGVARALKPFGKMKLTAHDVVFAITDFRGETLFNMSGAVTVPIN